MSLKLPSRPDTGHKGTFGSLAIIAGQISSGNVMLGSAVFVAKAAVRSGVGLVYFVGQKQVLVELVKMFPQAVGSRLENIKNLDAIVIGPGLGQSSSSVNNLKKALVQNLPTVIDADGLNIMANHPKLASLVHDKCLITPHPGEFDRLAKAFKVDSGEKLAKKLGCCVVLKGAKTQVTDGNQIWKNQAVNSALATGGTGDVLAGLVGGLLAQHYPKLSIFDCAQLGVLTHSQAGFAWSQKNGSAGLIIDELIDLLPETIERLRAKTYV